MSESCVDEAQQRAYQDALGFLYDRINYERMSSGASRYPFGLQRIRTLLSRLGLQKHLDDSPIESDVPIIHIAGTKGKGSTAAMVAAGLTAAGFKTGLYTSPHLHDLEERFRVDGTNCPRADVIAMVDRIRPVVAEMGEEAAGSPSFFELTTAMALLHFDSSGCDAIVLEVGLGGRLDSTNVCSPRVTAITSIGLDHQNVLGDTIEEIAAEKAGIIKRGVPVVSGVTAPAAAAVIERVATAHHAPLVRVGHEFSFQFRADDEWGSQVTYRAGPTLPDASAFPDGSALLKRPSCPNAESGEQLAPARDDLVFDLTLDGEHQAHNAAVAVACLDVLREQGFRVPSSAVVDGLKHVQCDGRIERFSLRENTMAIVDAAHNGDSIDALCDCLRRRCRDRRVTVIFGTSCDKSAQRMLQSISQIADELVLTQFQRNPRYQPAKELVRWVHEPMRSNTRVIANPIEACDAGLASAAPGGVLVICGSFFLVSETRRWLSERAVGRLV